MLAAASAAFFGGAPGNAAIESETSLITQMTVSATDIFEGDSHTTTASLLTNLNGDSLVDRVDWTVEADGDDDPEHEWPDDDPGVSSDFDFAYDNLGSTTGAAVVVKAVAADANGNTNTDQATINVWTKSETVNIVSQTSDQTLVGAATTNVSVQTDVGFYRVDWSIDGGTPISDNGPGLTSQITYDFSTVPYGNIVAFTATPYGVNANGEAVAGNAATINIRVVEPISSVTMSLFQSNAVVGEQIHLSAYSDAPYHTMEWYLDDSETPIRSVTSGFAGYHSAYTTYTFEAGQGSNTDSGRKYVIKAVAYAIEPKEGKAPIQWVNQKDPPGEPIISGARVESAGSSFFVHEGKDKDGYGVTAWIDSVDIADDRSYTLTWWHNVWYYNDVPGAEPRIYTEEDEDEGAHASLYAWIKMFEWDEEGNRFDSWSFHPGGDDGAEGKDLLLGLEVRYSGSTTATFTEPVGYLVDRNNDGVKEHFEPKLMTKNHEYRFLANTTLNEHIDQVTKGGKPITWTSGVGLKMMYRTDRRKYIGDLEDAPGPVDSGSVWMDGWNSVGGSTGAFDEW